MIAFSARRLRFDTPWIGKDSGNDYKTISASKKLHQVPLRVDYYSQMVLEDPECLLLSCLEHSRPQSQKDPEQCHKIVK